MDKLSKLLNTVVVAKHQIVHNFQFVKVFQPLRNERSGKEIGFLIIL